MPKWSIPVFIFIVVVAAAWFGNITSGGLIGGGTMANLQALSKFEVFKLGGTNGFLNPSWVAAWDFTFDYPMFSGDYAQYIRTFLGVLVGGFLLTIGMWVANLLRGN